MTIFTLFLSMLKCLGKQAAEIIIVLSEEETSSFLFPVPSISGTLGMFGLCNTSMSITSAFLMDTESRKGNLNT